MANVEFDEGGYGNTTSPSAIYQPKKVAGSFSVRMIMKMGIAKNERDAEWVLITLAVLMLVITALVIALRIDFSLFSNTSGGDYEIDERGLPIMIDTQNEL